MKKLVVILCMLGVLFGEGEKSLVEHGDEARKQKQYKQAAKLYQKACDRGEANGCSQLGNIYFWIRCKRG